MGRSIVGRGDKIRVKGYTLRAISEDEWAEMDGDLVAIWTPGIVVMLYAPSGECIGAFCGIDLSYGADGFDRYTRDAELLGPCGEQLNADKLLGGDATAVYAGIETALDSLETAIALDCRACLSELKEA